MLNINDRIKYVRERLRLSQTEFSEALSVNQAYLSRYETGVAKNIPDEFIFKLNKVFNINIHWLYVGEGPVFYETPDKAFLQGSDDDKDELLTSIFENPRVQTALQNSLKDFIEKSVRNVLHGY